MHNKINKPSWNVILIENVMLFRPSARNVAADKHLNNEHVNWIQVANLLKLIGFLTVLPWAVINFYLILKSRRQTKPPVFVVFGFLHITRDHFSIRLPDLTCKTSETQGKINSSMQLTHDFFKVNPVVIFDHTDRDRASVLIAHFV
jgi:hypothetical protein